MNCFNLKLIITFRTRNDKGLIVVSTVLIATKHLAKRKLRKSVGDGDAKIDEAGAGNNVEVTGDVLRADSFGVWAIAINLAEDFLVTI